MQEIHEISPSEWHHLAKQQFCKYFIQVNNCRFCQKQKGTHATPALKETLDAKKDSPKEQNSHHDANKKHDKQHDNQHVEKQKPESVPTESGDKQPAE